MKRFCVLSQSGEVLRTGCCQDDMIDAQAGAGETALEVDIDYIEPPDQPPPLDVKALRNRLLMASDWTQLPDVPLATKADWATYRQALRDIPDQPGFPHAVIWPTAPV